MIACKPIGLGRVVEVRLWTLRLWPLPVWIVVLRLGRSGVEWSVVTPWGRIA